MPASAGSTFDGFAYAPAAHEGGVLESFHACERRIANYVQRFVWAVKAGQKPDGAQRQLILVLNLELRDLLRRTIDAEATAARCDKLVRSALDAAEDRAWAVEARAADEAVQALGTSQRREEALRREPEAGQSRPQVIDSSRFGNPKAAKGLSASAAKANYYSCHGHRAETSTDGTRVDRAAALNAEDGMAELARRSCTVEHLLGEVGFLRGELQRRQPNPALFSDPALSSAHHARSPDSNLFEPCAAAAMAAAAAPVGAAGAVTKASSRGTGGMRPHSFKSNSGRRANTKDSAASATVAAAAAAAVAAAAAAAAATAAAASRVDEPRDVIRGPSGAADGTADGAAFDCQRNLSANSVEPPSLGSAGLAVTAAVRRADAALSRFVHSSDSSDGDAPVDYIYQRRGERGTGAPSVWLGGRTFDDSSAALDAFIAEPARRAAAETAVGTSADGGDNHGHGGRSGSLGGGTGGGSLGCGSSDNGGGSGGDGGNSDKDRSESPQAQGACASSGSRTASWVVARRGDCGDGEHREPNRGADPTVARTSSVALPRPLEFAEPQRSEEKRSEAQDEWAHRNPSGSAGSLGGGEDGGGGRSS
ncbi:unnamed protein product, partial [Phaeothamnion confervicola]